jgi:surface antigen
LPLSNIDKETILMKKIFRLFTIVIVMVIMSIITGCSSEKDDQVSPVDDATSLAPSLSNIRVTQPNGSEVLDPLINGKGTANIRWTQYGISNVNVALSRNGGSTWETIAAGVPANSCVLWNVKGQATSSARIKVTSIFPLSPPSDVSDNNFAVIGPYYKSFPGGYCTEYASREFDRVAPQVGRWGGNAQDWVYRASLDGWTTSTNPSDPRIRNGTVICWGGGTYGHVGIVRSVAKNAKGTPLSITIEEMNYGKFTIPSSAITINFGKVTSANLLTSNLSHGGLPFIGYILPIRK